MQQAPLQLPSAFAAAQTHHPSTRWLQSRRSKAVRATAGDRHCAATTPTSFLQASHKLWMTTGKAAAIKALVTAAPELSSGPPLRAWLNDDEYAAGVGPQGASDSVT